MDAIISDSESLSLAEVEKDPRLEEDEGTAAIGVFDDAIRVILLVAVEDCCPYLSSFFLELLTWTSEADVAASRPPKQQIIKEKRKRIRGR